jgi:hypothetical protein
VAWEALFLYDLLIFSLTLFRSYKDRFRFGGPRHASLVSLVTRDGTSAYPYDRERETDKPLGAIYFGYDHCYKDVINRKLTSE